MRFALPLILVSAGALSVPVLIAGGSGSTEPPPPPANTEFAGVLLRVGLGGEALAAAGAGSAEVTALVAAVEGRHGAQTLAGLDEAFIQAKQSHDRLARTVRSGKGSQADVAALRTAEAALGNATSARGGYLVSLRDAGLATLPAQKAAIVRAIQANKSWGLPTQYLVKNRSEAEWVALRSALATKRISEEDPEETFDPSAQAALAVVDAEAEISAAKVSLETNINAVQTAWNTAASD